MKSYLDLLEHVKNTGDIKASGRENMPGTRSVFGHQIKHSLSTHFPLLTTKHIGFNQVVVELLWFMQGKTNVKWLIDRGVRFWNEDSYAYYTKTVAENSDKYKAVMKILDDTNYGLYSFDEYVAILDSLTESELPAADDYTLGDCGNQYGKTWRNFNGAKDQLKSMIDSARTNPASRRHIISSIDPQNDDDLALYWCHSMFQLNFVKLTDDARWLQAFYNQASFSETKYLNVKEFRHYNSANNSDWLRDNKIPEYSIDSQMYQRSADVFLGVPLNIASYALLTHIIGMMTNSSPRNYVHSFGDVHIYDNHMSAVTKQLERRPSSGPKLDLYALKEFDWTLSLDEVISNLADRYLEIKEHCLCNYNAQPSIKAVLSTGITK